MDKQDKPKRKGLQMLALTLAMLLAVGVFIWAVFGAGKWGGVPAATSSLGGVQPQSALSMPENSYQAIPLPEEMRAMWVVYLEWMARDISSEEMFRAEVAQMFDACRALGLNTVIVAVRPYADALYQSEVYPWSDLLTGIPGQAPGFDPLAIAVQEAHARGLRLEAMVNPYRVRTQVGYPESYAPNSPAVLHPEWVKESEGWWFDPGYPAVSDMIVEGIREIVANYEVDGIHLDDYFYPEHCTEEFDNESYALYGEGKPREEWRRENTSGMVARAYAAVKAENPTVSFGISPQGNNDNNYNGQRIDVKLWMSTPGYVDYVMPQLYWGFNYRLANGSDRFAFANIAAEWAGYPRAEGVHLYAGLGAYRIAEGDGGSNDQSEWQSGRNLADMVLHLRGQTGFSGFSLFRYDYLFRNTDPLFAEEEAALREILT